MDLYKTLGITRQASQEDIKKAFRKLALECHPDRNSGGSKASAAVAEKRFREVSEAYEILGNEAKRDMYNRGLASGRTSSGNTQWASTSQPYYGAPRAHSGWANFRYRQKKYPGVISGNFAAFFSSMTKHDGYFHLLMTGAVLGGFLFMSTAGESFWRNANKGRLFEDLPARDRPVKAKRKAETKPPTEVNTPG